MYGGRAPKGELCNKVCMCVSMCVCMYVCILPQCKIVTSFSGSGAASKLFMGEKTRKNGGRTPSIRRRNSRVSYKTWRGKNARNTPNTSLDGCHLLLKEYICQKKVGLSPKTMPRNRPMFWRTSARRYGCKELRNILNKYILIKQLLNSAFVC